MQITYELTFPGGAGTRVDVVIDPDTLELRAPLPVDRPEWTRLENEQCANCPLRASETSHCPLALSLVELVELSGDVASFASLHAKVTTPERVVSADTTAQRAVASLMGLVIATSGCPHTTFFRPMARFHLPFASEEETVYRATSTYLLGQYFKAQGGAAPDLVLEGLHQTYQAMQKVNKHIALRLRGVIEKDASVNALILLDLFSKALPDIIEDQLDEIRHLFEPFIDVQASGIYDRKAG